MNNGLDDVIATETVMSDVDGLAGRLVIRGHSLDDLAGHVGYEDLVAILLDGFFQDLPSPAALASRLGMARRDVFEMLVAGGAPDRELPATDALRAAMARLGDGEDLDVALRLIAAPAILTPAIIRQRRGEAAIAPDPTLGHAADMLRMLHGTVPRWEAAAALDTYLVTVSDHGLNASTFTARVVASTQAGLTSAVLAALSALKGPLHGGAPGPVLDMLDGIAAAQTAEAWLEAALDRGDRLMGFGHRVYRVRDPRAEALKRAVAALFGPGTNDRSRLALAEHVEAAATSILARRKPDRSLQINVEFYTALLLEALGFPRESFTSVFATGRVAGWIGHAREQVLYGRLIRPQSRYVGPRPDQAA
ncbi:citrate synthase/methylcitrate synthase [Labrys sp. LIt4]|uniref:citrate synthase/methylcitrate synthase n=1 Tax=Labrys sp. LIt4 TaxID=2821355 RepID=UPI001ADFB226|nr:citrate synthase/methylcitrate synthase [Labrys sp. LIt4]MBP0579391.1 citrate synthase/methylcitrate synthase [Labrys sp. LIt4]